MKDVILTGLRANDELTLGNYLGGILPIIEIQRKYSQQYQINMFVPDLHSFTTPIDHSKLQDSIINNLKVYTAAGLNLDDDNTFIYRQSYIPAHSELTWILDCFTGVGEMSRMTQFKDKSKSNFEKIQNEVIKKIDSNKTKVRNLNESIDENYSIKQLKKVFNTISELYIEKYDEIIELLKDRSNFNNASVGLFNYPVLMAADILLYNAKWIPVGEDQFQHLEITRDIAERFNKKFGPIFTIPKKTSEQVKFINRDKGLRIRSLTNPDKKMSKSNQNPKSKILLTDDPKQAYKKIMSATTDSIGQINYDWQNQPGITNLMTILSLLSNQDIEQVKQTWVGQTQYGELKKAVAKAVADFLTDFQTKYNAVDKAKLQAKLEQSEQAMNKIAKETLLRAQQAVGLRP